MSFNVTYIYEIRDKFSLAAKKIKDSIDNVKKSTDRANKGFKGFNRKLKKTSINVIRVSRKMKSLGKAIKGVGDSMKGASVVLGAQLALSLKAFIDFEKGITNVFTLLSDEELLKFREPLTEAAKEAIRLGFSIKDTTSALFDIVSSLGATEKSLEVFKQAQILAIAGGAELKIAVQGITSVMNAYGVANTDAAQVSNTFFTAQKKGVTTVAQLSSNIGKVAADARAVGVDFKELITTLSILTKGGLSTDESATGLRSALVALRNPTVDARKRLKALGIPFGITQIRAKGLSFTLEQIIKASKKYPDQLARAIPSIRAFTAAITLNDERLQMIRDSLKEIEQDYKTGSGLISAFTKNMGTLGKKIGKTFGNLKDLAIEIGGRLKPVVVALLTVLDFLIESFLSLPQPVKDIVIIGAALLAILAPIILGIAALAGFIAAAVAALGALGVSLAGVAPVALTIAGISAVIVAFIAGIVALIVWFEDLQRIAISVVNNIGKNLATLVNTFTNLPLLKGNFNLEANQNVLSKGVDDIIASFSQKSEAKMDANININAPVGVVKSSNVKTKAKNMDLGVNLAGAS